MRGNPKAFIKEGDLFLCECGRKFSKSQSLYAHQGRCKIHLGDRYDPEKHKAWNVGDARAWSRGKTKYTSESVRLVSEKHSLYLKNLGESNPLVVYNKNKPRKSYDNQSRTRKAKYASGELVPAKGVGRGKYSYLTYNGKCIMLRSTYEFIYALYLLYNNIDFEYETVRVTTDKTYISDFLIGNKIVEIKGNYNADTRKSEEAFKSNGYEYEVKFWKDLEPCYEFLLEKLDINDIIEKIRVGHDNHNYYRYNYVNNVQ